MGYSDILNYLIGNLISTKLGLKTLESVLAGGDSDYSIPPTVLDLVIRLGLITVGSDQAKIGYVPQTIHLTRCDARLQIFHPTPYLEIIAFDYD
jgi:hypothetical protein